MMGGHIEEGTGRGHAVPNVTAHPSTVGVPIAVWLYNGPWLCGFNVHVSIKASNERPIQCKYARNYHSTIIIITGSHAGIVFTQ